MRPVEIQSDQPFHFVPWWARVAARRQAAPGDLDAQYYADLARKAYDRAVFHDSPGFTVLDKYDEDGNKVHTLSDDDKPTTGYTVSKDYGEQRVPTLPSPHSLRNHRETYPDEEGIGGWEFPKITDEDEVAQHPDHHPQWYSDIPEVIDDPWEAGGAALQRNQIGLFDNAEQKYYKSFPFVHDQIAKGGARQ